jgi:hypothetical protein
MSQSDVFSVEAEYVINFTTKKPVPIPDIIESLEGIQDLLSRTPKFIELAYKDVTIINVEVFVDSLQAGSLKKRFLVRYFFNKKENLDKAIKIKEDSLDLMEDIMDGSPKLNAVVGVSIAALVGVGIGLAYDNVTGATTAGQQPNHIEAYNSTIINAGGDIGFGTGELSALVNATTDKKRLVKNTLKAVKPALSDPESTIEMANNELLIMSKEVILQVPKDYTPPVPEEIEEHYSNVKIIIYASDRDRVEVGWAGLVPEVVDTRIKFILGEGVDPKKIYGQKQTMADITVTKRFNASKKAYEAKSVLIKKTN